jgi:hypothetical protein
LIFAWVFFAQPSRLGTAQASAPASPYESENVKLQADANLLKRENERLRYELDKAKKDTLVTTPTDAQGPSAPTTALAQALGGTGKVVRANALIVEDENGKPRVMLGVLKGVPGMVVFDEKGMARVALGVDENGPGLTLADAAGRPVWSTANSNPPASAVSSKGETKAPAKVEPPQCPTCKGTGVLGQCSACEGTGKALGPQVVFGELQSTARRVAASNGRECPECKGTGMKPCFRCGGSGKVTPPEREGQVPGAIQTPDGKWYVPDPARPGKFILVKP